jgi:hypothetical protein
MSKLHKALRESPNVLTAKDVKWLREMNDMARGVDKPEHVAKAREYIEELARSLKLAQASKKKRKGAK